jgi:hypothetical protein
MNWNAMWKCQVAVHLTCDGDRNMILSSTGPSKQNASVLRN